MPSTELPLKFDSGRPALDCDALLSDTGSTRDSVFKWLSSQCEDADPTLVVGLESWGYLFAAPTALSAGLALAVARRRTDRLGPEAVTVTYDMHKSDGNRIGMEHSSVDGGARTLLIDDSVVSGKTLEATCDIVHRLGGEVVAACAVLGVSGRRREADPALSVPLHCYQWA
jgi:adenine phosphoribosyltransferase